MSKKHLHLATAAVVVACAAGPAVAQTGAKDTEVDEVIVTATKQSQNIQDVPAAVTAVSGEILAARGVTDLRGLQNLVPATRLQVQNDITQAFIRGIGTGYDGAWVPETVATNLDGASLPRNLTGMAVYDVASVEVLPGPQGTLYGRSAVGGVVNINANRPSAARMAEVRVELGNYGAVRGDLVLNAPVSDALRLRGAFTYDENDGYNENGTYSKDALGGRLSALVEPSEEVSVYLWASYYRNRPRVSPIAYFPAQKHDPFEFPDFDASSAQFYPPNGVDNRASRGRYRGVLAGAEVVVGLGPVRLTYIPTVLDYEGHDDRVIGGFIQDIRTDIRQQTHELRFNNALPGDRLQYVAGLYWNRNETLTDFVFGPFFGGGIIPHEITTAAAYGQATFAATDTLRISAGLRYSSDKVENDGSIAYFPIFNPATFRFDAGRVPFAFDETWNKVAWKIGVEADVGADSMAYAAVQTGFNPGAYDTNAVPVRADRTIEPQEVTAYTAGIKNRFLDRRLTLNAEAYYYDYTDFILQQYNAATGGIIIYNAPKVVIRGVEVSGAWAVTPDVRLSMLVGYTDSEIRRFQLNGVNYRGFELPSAPKVTAVLGYEQVFRLPGDATLTFSYVSDSYWTLFDQPRGARQPAYTKTDLSLTYAPASRSWDAGLWVKNLEDTVVMASAGATTQPFPRGVVAYVEPPRTYGVRLRARFGD